MKPAYDLEFCPICGSKIADSGLNIALMKNLDQLKQEGILEHTLIVAVSIVKTMNDNNPAWLRELLQDHIKEIEKNQQEQLREIRDHQDKKSKASLQAIQNAHRDILSKLAELLGNPQALGKIQEQRIAKRLSSLKIGEDSFSTEKATKSMEDVECVVKENGRTLGKIVIESKKTKKWSQKSVEQLRGYMEKENTQFGILASSTLPDDALNETIWKDGILIVKPQHIETAYIFLRQYLILSTQLEMEHRERLSGLEVREFVMHELQNAIRSGELDAIIEAINMSTDAINSHLARAEQYIAGHFKKVRRETKRIQDYTSRLMINHIEKIRMQLLDTLIPTEETTIHPIQ